MLSPAASGAAGSPEAGAVSGSLGGGGCAMAGNDDDDVAGSVTTGFAMPLTCAGSLDWSTEDSKDMTRACLAAAALSLGPLSKDVSCAAENALGKGQYKWGYRKLLGREVPAATTDFSGAEGRKARNATRLVLREPQVHLMTSEGPTTITVCPCCRGSERRDSVVSFERLQASSTAANAEGRHGGEPPKRPP